MKKLGGNNTGAQEIAAGSCANWYKYFGSSLKKKKNQLRTTA